MAYAVLTRESIGDYAAVLAELGLQAIAMPVTRFVPARDPEALARALDEGNHDYLFITSQHAAEELVRAAAGRPVAPVWAVGPATLRVLERAGIDAYHPEGVRNATELAKEMVGVRHFRHLRGNRVLVPRALDGRIEPLQILRHMMQVTDVVAYGTEAVAADDPSVQRGSQLLRGAAAAVCVVFAPSQVAALALIVGELRSMSTHYCAIGDTTADALHEAGIERVAVAPEPTPAGIAHAVSSVYPRRT